MALSQETRSMLANLFVSNVELSEQLKEKDAQIEALKKEIEELKAQKES